MTAPTLIVTADDFGLSEGVNRGVIDAHENGIVTGASLVVRAPAAPHAAAYARANPDFDLGLHLDLGEWRYADNTWTAHYEVVDTRDEQAVEAEVVRQLDAFRRLTGRAPTHLDSHQHVHRHHPVLRVGRAVARRLHVPLREQHPTIRYRGDFFGQTGRGDPYPDAITVEALTTLIAALPAGVTELGCHPGYAADTDTTYRHEREREVAVLCDPRVRSALDRTAVVLTSFTSALTKDRP